MIRDSGQFGSFDGLDNRRAIMELLRLLGQGLPVEQANQKRADFLRSLVKSSQNGFRRAIPQITPCNHIDGYALFMAITGVLGVPIETAARKLEEAVRKQ